MTSHHSGEAVEKEVADLKRALLNCRRREEALQKIQETYTKMVEDSLTGIYIDQDGRIVFANETFAEIYGWQLGELIGIESRELVHPDDRELTDKRRTKRLKGEKPRSEYDARGITKQGKTIWVRRRNTHIEYEGKPAILGNIVDITEQKQAEKKIQRASEELEDFVRVVSHDLKNPIVAIQGFASRLFKGYQEQLGEKGQRYLNQIQASADQMELLVSDLLKLSRLGRVEPNFQEVSARDVIQKVVSGLQDRLKENKIELIVPEKALTVRCDKERVHQIIENLLTNAIKFTRGRKRPRVEIGYEDKGDFHQFFVKDNGIGIDPKHHDRIFETFHRLKDIEDAEGTGLGLAIVKRGLEIHGGKAWVESQKGHGATFFFTLPKEPRSVRGLEMTMQASPEAESDRKEDI